MEAVGRSGSVERSGLPRNTSFPDTSSKGLTGSGTGSSEDSLASEVGRLSEENAHYRRKLAELMGKAPAVPNTSRAMSGILGGNVERLREQIKSLKRENHRLVEQNATLERRLSCSRSSASADQLWRYKEEIRSLRAQNSQLLREKDKFDRTAEYVCQKVLKIINGARREGNFNSQLVGELKRWNEKLEDENYRLYNIIERMQQKTSDVDDAVAEANVLSQNHDKDRDGNAAIVKQLETQNVKIQEEMLRLSDQAMSLQNLSSSSSGSSGPLPPRTPSNHEQDGTARRSRTPEKRSRTPEKEIAGGPRSTNHSRRNSRTLDTALSGSTQDFEFLKKENKKYSEEIEKIGADLAFVREQISAKDFREKSPKKEKEVEKLEAALRNVNTLERANTSQAQEIERLLESQLELKDRAKAADLLKDEYEQMEDDCIRLASEIERLEPIARRVTECEELVATYQQRVEELQGSGNAHNSDEVTRLKSEHVELQRTLSELAAEKSVLQAELRELLEERNALQSDIDSLEMQVRDLQERLDEAEDLRGELEDTKEDNLTYAKQIDFLNEEKEQLLEEISSLKDQLTYYQGGSSGLANGGILRASQTEKAEVNAKDERDEEIASLKAENEDLAQKAFSNVMLTVELTTLRNQVKDYQLMEGQFEEHRSALKQLKLEKLALQQEADSIPTLKAEIAELQEKLSEYEKQNEGLLSQSSPTQSHLEQEERSQLLNQLQEDKQKLEINLGHTESRLGAVQAKYDSLLKDHTQRSQQAVRDIEIAESGTAALELALRQEKNRAAQIGQEAAELHALLQTATNERHTLQKEFAELRVDNTKLLKRIAQLDAKTEDQERTLEAVLGRGGVVNGHASHTTSAREPSPTRVSGLHGGDSAERSAFTASPFSTNNGGGNNSKKAKTEANGKSSDKGFSFFKRNNNKGKNKEQPVQSPRVEPVNVSQPIRPVSPPPQRTPAQFENPPDPDDEVLAVYEQYVDSDDIDGFMTALGYRGFRSPTAPDDMKGAFSAAKYVVRPEALLGKSDYDQLKGEAVYDLLEAWHGAWVETTLEAQNGMKTLQSMSSA